MEKTPILEVRSLSLSFTRYTSRWEKGLLRVIDDLSLRLYSGEVVAVMGASGSGKSLLAHAILGLLPDNARLEGSLLYEGQPLSRQRAAQLRGREIVLVPQSVSYLDPLMQIGAQLRRGAQDGESRRKTRQTLERYGLGAETEKLYPFALSGGMARRVLISSAVLETPKLVVADEPTPGLQLPVARRVLGHFREMAEAGAAVLLITHDLELAAETADRVVVFYAGTTLEEARADDFASENTLRHPYTRTLWRAMPKNGFHAQGSGQPNAGERTAGCPFRRSCPLAAADCGESVPYREKDGGYVRCVREDCL